MEFHDSLFDRDFGNWFEEEVLETFRFQFSHNETYRTFVLSLGKSPENVKNSDEIPFLPIEFFKSHEVICGSFMPQAVFRSSGTTGSERSRHLVKHLDIYRKSLTAGFRRVFGDPGNIQFLALTPAPDQASESSLVFMIRLLMDMSSSAENGFFLNNPTGLRARLNQRRAPGRKVMLIGLSYALLDFISLHPGNYHDLIVVETGGMKGRRHEMVREELHSILRQGFGVEKVCSEYGMTELLSQAWSTGDGLFSAPPWMSVRIREMNDPFSYARPGTTGGINIIDLANRHSCSFIATRDLGRMHPGGLFEVLGRFDDAEARGCSLMI